MTRKTQLPENLVPVEELVGHKKPFYNYKLVDFETDRLLGLTPRIDPYLIHCGFGYEPYQEASLRMMESALNRIP